MDVFSFAGPRLLIHKTFQDILRVCSRIQCLFLRTDSMPLTTIAQRVVVFLGSFDEQNRNMGTNPGEIQRTAKVKNCRAEGGQGSRVHSTNIHELARMKGVSSSGANTMAMTEVGRRITSERARSSSPGSASTTKHVLLGPYHTCIDRRDETQLQGVIQIHLGSNADRQRDDPNKQRNDTDGGASAWSCAEHRMMQRPSRRINQKHALNRRNNILNNHNDLTSEPVHHYCNLQASRIAVPSINSPLLNDLKPVSTLTDPCLSPTVCRVMAHGSVKLLSHPH